MIRSVLLLLLVGCPAVGLVILGAGWYQMAAFLRSTSAIRTDRDLARFRDMAGRQMKLALVQIGVLAVPALVYIGGLSTHHLAFGDLAWLVVPMVAVLVAGVAMKKTENRAKTLPVEGERLQQGYEQTIHTWMKKALPDWDKGEKRDW